MYIWLNFYCRQVLFKHTCLLLALGVRSFVCIVDLMSSVSLQASGPTSVKPARGPSPWSTAWFATKGSTWSPAEPTEPRPGTTTPARTETPAPRRRPPPARPRRTRASAAAAPQGPRSWRRRTVKRKVTNQNQPCWRKNALQNQMRSLVRIQSLRPPSLLKNRTLRIKLNSPQTLLLTKLPANKLLTQRQLLATTPRTPPKTAPPHPQALCQRSPWQPPRPRASYRGCWRSTPSPLWSTSCPTESLLWWG